MTELVSAQDLFKGRHFDQEIIVLSVRWYLTFKLSSRDLVQMMAERGIAVAHTTILRWVLRYVQSLKSAGTDMRGRWEAPGARMRLISRCVASGSTFIEPSTNRAEPLIFF
jgi:hypothetical protein